MLEARSSQLELLDLPTFSRREAVLSYAFMSFFNRFLGGIRVVREFLAAEAAQLPVGRTLRVLDLGSGSCDIPVAITHWATRHHLPIQFTCLEISQYALEMCRKRVGDTAGAVQVLAEDAFQHRPAEPYDCAVGSLFFHHLTDENILKLIQHLRGFVRRGVLINDLLRSRYTYALASVLTAPLPHVIRHDALVSIQRGFTLPELPQLLRALDGAPAKVRRLGLFRLEAIVRFEGVIS